MKIEIRLYASFRRLLPDDCAANECFADVEEGTTVKDLLVHLGVAPDAPKVVFLNGVHAEGNELLKEGDRVGAFPPVAGG